MLNLDSLKSRFLVALSLVLLVIIRIMSLLSHGVTTDRQIKEISVQVAKHIIKEIEIEKDNSRERYRDEKIIEPSGRLKRRGREREEEGKKAGQAGRERLG